MSYNVRDPELEALQRRIADQITSQLPAGWGMSLFIFNFNEPDTNCFYISNAERPTIIQMLKAWLSRQIQ